MKINIILVTFSLALSSCTTLNSVELEINHASKISFFKGIPPKKGERRAYHQALTSGYLIIKNDCLYLERKRGNPWGSYGEPHENLTLLTWPWNFSLVSSNQGIHVMNGSQKVFAKVGGYYYFGGSGNYLSSSTKVPKKYKKCINNNVTSYWGVSPERINRHSKTRKALQKFMKR